MTFLCTHFSNYSHSQYPETASFLDEDERQYLIERLKHDRTHLSTAFDMRFVWQAFKDWKLYAQIGVYIG